MLFEHYALNVLRPKEMANWYIAHLGLELVSQQDEAPFMTFLADSSHRVVMELYHRPDAEMTDFKEKHPLTFHMAFISKHAGADKHRLMAEGASFCEEVRKEDGSHLVMLRDPWGIPLQLCQRTNGLYPIENSVSGRKYF
jgi:catechol 2,3-dioxygenase-like lactoylglutathione lyase family enzyme